MVVEFKHHQSAHCENGVASNLLRHNGLNLSEPMIFGLGSGIFFVYIPFLKVNHAPAISYRPQPGIIFSRVAKRLGIRIRREKFNNPEDARKALEENLANGIPTGLQVGVFHLPYFPDQYRFHFNAHNLVVYGKEEGKYLVSDPVMEGTTSLSDEELEKVRYAKGALAPRGQMYFPTYIPANIDLKKAIVKAIQSACSTMLAPVPIVGVRGERLVARKIRKWPEKVGVKTTNHYLAQIVRMQEEIGTGGGGFRYIYAAFLQEAADILEKPELKALSVEMTSIGDEWRDFALNASRILKNRKAEDGMYQALADQLDGLADREEAFFKKLKKAV
ncbi:MAG: BtrH N-terminal domain-containing protein [Leadbetterella sp.]|nr:BtrH N-terminal domain-containing protein [Leadbetterella sp.]